MRQIWAAGVALGLATAGLTAQDDALTAKARAIHERVMTLDTHNDISPNNFTAECNYTMDLGNQVNLPKMIKGGLDASFFIVYVGQDTSANLPPMGMRVRLRKDYDTSTAPAQARVILEALKNYGMFLANVGTALGVTGTPDQRWDQNALNALRNVSASDLEVIEMNGVVVGE